eukprot:Tamp_15551.p1 GENE.Tamp_15551~~Tamp_15551.p1  ORF type:complete len:494 (+),score=74.66 Tamp_15551:126-1484(+)
MHPAEARRIHVGQQAMLFLALLRELQGRRPQARAAYVSAMSSPASTPVNSLANIAKENLRALNGRPRQPSAGGGEWARRAREERFLVFRFWAGLSNRRQELIGMIAAARLLNRTLVLPDLVEGKWMANHETNRPREPVKAFYNEYKLSQYISIVEEQDFYSHIAPHLPPLSAELHIRDYAYPGQFAFGGLSYGCVSTVDPTLVQQPREPKHLVEDLARSPGQVLVIDFSYRLLDLGVPGEFAFFNGTAEWTPERVNVAFTPSDLFQQILQSLLFSNPLIQAADTVMASLGLGGVGGGGGGHEFLAVHLRRNDMKFWKNRQHSWPDTGQVLLQIEEALSSSGLSHVFLASDTSDEERHALQAALWRDRHTTLQFVGGAGGVVPPAGFSEAQLAVLDQVICARGRMFVGNFWSTFSWAIIEERFKIGHPVTSSLFFQAPLSRDDPRVGMIRKLD